MYYRIILQSVWNPPRDISVLINFTHRLETGLGIETVKG